MGAWTSGLSAADAAALGPSGFSPAGAVFGVSVFHVGFSGTAYCGGVEPNLLRAEQWRGSRTAGEWSGFGAAIAMLRKVRRRALDQLTAHARALDADGVIGIDLQLRPYDGDRRAIECTAWGTAVRAAETSKPLATPFLATVDAVDFAALLRNGWVPAGIALGVAVEIEHHDAATRAVTGLRGALAANAEIPAVTAAVQRARAEARRTCDGELDRMGAEGAIVTQITLQANETECKVYEGLRDTVAEAVVVATGITQFADVRRKNVAPTRRPSKARTKPA
ncbi:MAG: heavy metal-binding domain-containing protein, partial [Frankiales bacterium]|nr:heavy metal-binding domain-containing protein [Frankiales bacterium]